MRPIILNYSQPMHQDAEHSFFYDYERDMNVVKNENGLILPFIDSTLEQLCIMTKTEAYRESDDSPRDLLLISTKTFTTQETDDQPTNN